ncbi:hypothetical protein MOSE0_L10682 [Monosporozyma servazzii]
MAKTLAQGRKPGSGRKPGKAKTLKQGRKPGSGRRKRRNSNTTPVMPIPIQNSFNSNNTGNNSNNAHLFQSHMNVIPMNLQPINLPSNQNIMIPSYNHTTPGNSVSHMNPNSMNENNHQSSISTRDMVAVDALRELTHSPLSLTPMSNLPGTSKIVNGNKSLDDNVATTTNIENLTLPPLNEVFNNNDDDNSVRSSSSTSNSNNSNNNNNCNNNSNNNNNNNNNNNINFDNRDDDNIDKLPHLSSSISHQTTEMSTIEITRNGPTLPHFHSTETNFVSIDNGISNLNNNNTNHHQHQHQHQLQHNNNNLPHNNIL